MKFNKWRLLALICFLGAIGTWPLKENRWLFLYTESFYNQPVYTLDYGVPRNIPEETARILLNGYIAERGKLLAEGKLDIFTIHKLQESAFDLSKRVVYEYETQVLDYEPYTESAPPFSDALSNFVITLYRDRESCCNSPREQEVWRRLNEEDVKKSPEVKLVPSVQVEASSMLRYRITRSALLVLLGFFFLGVNRLLRTGKSFRRFVGQRTIRFATLSAAFAVCMVVSPATAMQLLVNVKKADQTKEQVVKSDTPDPLKSDDALTAKKTTLGDQLRQKVDRLTLWVFSDATHQKSGEAHDGQVIEQYTDHTGMTFIQQNRRTSDGNSITGNVTFGFSPKLHRSFDLTATVGPAFNYYVKGQKAGFNHQIVSFVIVAWRTPRVWVSALNKLMFPTDQFVSFGSRHIVAIRPPPERTPRALQGIAIQSEFWHVNGPGTPHWNEGEVGLTFNVGEMAGKPKSWLSWFSAFPYRDFCRPQPGHNSLGEVRVQFKRTFAFSH